LFSRNIGGSRTGLQRQDAKTPRKVRPSREGPEESAERGFGSTTATEAIASDHSDTFWRSEPASMLKRRETEETHEVLGEPLHLWCLGVEDPVWFNGWKRKPGEGVKDE